jgi:hypothetical protein
MVREKMQMISIRLIAGLNKKDSNLDHNAEETGLTLKSVMIAEVAIDRLESVNNVSESGLHASLIPLDIQWRSNDNADLSFSLRSINNEFISLSNSGITREIFEEC